MLKNCPVDIPKGQFKTLIEYLSLPSVQAMCSANSVNRKKQQWGHRMGSINFGRVRVGLHESSESKEEPTQLDVFIATRTGQKGKEIDLETQALIEKVNDHQVEGKTVEGAFQAVFGKERPGRIRCYGRTITASSLKKNKEINKIKQQHAMEKESLESQLKDTNERVQGLQDLVGLLMQQSNPNFNIDQVLAALRAKKSSPSDGNSARGPLGLSSTSTHVPNHD